MILLQVLAATAPFTALGLASPASSVKAQNATGIDACPGYKASDVKATDRGLTAALTLAGPACNVYGTDLHDLTLIVEHQSGSRLHVLIQDADEQVYQIPESVFTRPPLGHVAERDLEFDYVAEPFSFSVKRRSNGEIIFDTSGSQLIFESQYVRLRTKLPEKPSLYGTGEHTDPFMLNTTNYTRVIWNRDAYGTPAGTNLYGDHPVHFDHRGPKGTHGVFLLNANGKNIKIDNVRDQFLEYDLLGGVLDFYFLAGPTPVDVAQQYSEVVGKSAMFPYWGLGYHQCKYGYQDVYEVAEVVSNYSAANIPLETMWTDIDYMYLRRVFTLDPVRFPLDLMQQLVSVLHAQQQHYVLMVDPAVAYQDYPAFNEGVEQSVFYTRQDGSIFQGVVWPGVTAFPDWFHPNTQSYWNDQFTTSFNPDTGVDIDALWIDMNEAANGCFWPCSNATAFAIATAHPPKPPAVRLGSPRPIPGFPAAFQPKCKAEVTFSVNAITSYGENIFVFGSAITIGSGDITNAAPLNADKYPIWSATIDMPAETEITYQYVRSEPDGSYVYESENRTIKTGPCMSSGQSTNDSITSTSPPQSSLRRSLDLPHVELQSRQKRQTSGKYLGLPGRNLVAARYDIQNDAGSLSNLTLDTDLLNYDGSYVYDSHDLYGAQMSEASRQAMLNRRPDVRPLVITRSTFAGSGRQVGHWLGDNLADWDHYLYSIKQMLEFGALYQVPMVGSDVCGFGGATNELLCARWATLGAFAPFYRNHAQDNSPPHEFYRWPLVAEAAKNAIATRYQLLDYLYTAMYKQNQTGVPLVQPMFFKYPLDTNVNSLAHQYFYGPGIMVAPVTEENSTEATFYMPEDIFYDFYTFEKIQGQGGMMTITNVDYTTIPLYYKGGSIVVQRVQSANTTTELRKQNFKLVIAPDAQDKAEGELYLDDGDSLVQKTYSAIHFSYQHGRLTTKGHMAYQPGVTITSVVVLGNVSLDGTWGKTPTSSDIMIPLTQPWSGDV